jgi:hypothetical protein
MVARLWRGLLFVLIVAVFVVVADAASSPKDADELTHIVSMLGSRITTWIGP